MVSVLRVLLLSIALSTALGASCQAGEECASKIDAEGAPSLVLLQNSFAMNSNNRIEQDPSGIAMLNYDHLVGRKTEEDSYAHKVTHFGRSYFVSPNPDLGLKSVFDDIANNNKWGSEESVSGTGSELAMTAPVRECLGKWNQKYNVQVFVDVPCGDANWQAHIPGLEHGVYKGYDIADTPVQHARQNNSKHSWMSFDLIDLTTEVPPVKPDIIMVRDVIQHLPLKKGRQMLLNAKRSGARYLAVTTFTDGGNVEVPAGSFYKNDVHAEPFNLPSRVEACRNYASGNWKSYPSDYLELIDLSTWNPSDLLAIGTSTSGNTGSAPGTSGSNDLPQGQPTDPDTSGSNDRKDARKDARKAARKAAREGSP